MKKCSVAGCARVYYCRSYCRLHHSRNILDPNKTKKYEKTPDGFLMRAYRNMKSRVTGVQKKKAHLYVGKTLLPKEEFYAWSRDNKDFWRLYKNWVDHNYDRKLSPSVNRIDSTKGYEIGNIEWITHSLNSALSSVTKRNKTQEISIIYKTLGVK